jgi:serine/threonine-protein kinase
MTTELEEQRQRARAAREALVGRSIAGKYVIQKLIGHGGMGAVYEAVNEAIGKRVAIKFVDPEFATDEQVVKRFAREARAMSAIESAHIVSVFDAGSEDRRPYLVMELLRGEDLGERLRRTRRVPLGESMHVIAQVLKGLARAHAAGVVHRDLKPDNVFLAKTDMDPLFAKIVDFGISKIERPRVNTSPLALTGRGTVLGTPLYMSPEQAQCSADLDARADLYSVGAILFECLSGRPPHTGETYEQIILSICMSDAPDLRAIEPSVPEPVARFVARALGRDKAQRHPTAERMLAALHEVAPAERTRVPLDPQAPVTMVSAGATEGAKTVVAATPMDAPPQSPAYGAATRLGIATLGPAAPDTAASAPSTPREPAPAAVVVDAVTPAARPAAPAAAMPKPRRPGKPARPAPPARASRTGMLLATAAAATLTGVGVTVALLYATGKDPAPQRAPASGVHETTSAAAPSPSLASSSPSPSPWPSAAFAALEAAPEASTKPSATPAPKPSTLPPLPGSGRPAGKPTAPPPKLDIQRDLPP